MGGGGGAGGGIYCAVQKEKVCGHVTMVAKFLGEFKVYCAFHKHAQPRSQSSSGISDVTFPVKTREL